MVRAIVILLLWGLQTAIIVTAVDAAWIAEQLRREERQVASYLGGDTAAHLNRRARTIYRAAFIDTGVAPGTYDRLLPDPSRPKHGLEPLAPWLFEWLRERLDAVWWLAFQAIHRAMLLLHWMSYFAVILVAVLVDGLVARKVKHANHGHSNVIRYRAGVRALLALLLAPLVYLTVPISVHPVVIPAWLLVSAAALWITTANLQKRI